MQLLSSVRRAAMLGALAASILPAQAVRSTAGFTLSTLARNDDASTGLVATGFTFNLFGLSQNQLFVNNNGNVTFTQALSTYTPNPISGSNLAILAPFWADVDTENAASGVTEYGTGLLGGRNAFAVNWFDVGYFESRAELRNTFQLIMVDRSETGAGNFDFEFNYSQVQWDTGEASSGVNGLCSATGSGTPARVGWANGAAASFELAGSSVCGALLDGGSNALISNSLNSDGVAGRYVWNVRNGAVEPSPPVTGVVPEPSTYALMATGLIGLVVVSRRRRSEV
jgi:hypothetical protein